MALASPG